MDFSIIIINYNLSREVKECLNSLINVENDSDFEIILIDNHSEDDSIIKIAGEFTCKTKPGFTFISTEKNIGFGNACNLAVEKASGQILLFLNPDTLVKEKFLGKVKNHFDSNRITGIVGINVSNKKLLDYSAGFFPNYFLEILNILLLGRYFEAFWIKLKVIFSGFKKLNVDWVMGAALFIRRDLFTQVKGFDPDYFLYFEEMDLCKRIIKKGLPVIYLPEIRIEHAGSVSSKKNYYFFTKMFYKGKLLFLEKHSGKSVFFIYKILFFLIILSQIALWWIVKLKNEEKSRGKIRAFKEILKSLNQPSEITNLSLFTNENSS
jgi:GT2 family glycosyltransferase